MSISTFVYLLAVLAFVAGGNSNPLEAQIANIDARIAPVRKLDGNDDALFSKAVPTYLKMDAKQIYLPAKMNAGLSAPIANEATIKKLNIAFPTKIQKMVGELDVSSDVKNIQAAVRYPAVLQAKSDGTKTALQMNAGLSAPVANEATIKKLNIAFPTKIQKAVGVLDSSSVKNIQAAAQYPAVAPLYQLANTKDTVAAQATNLAPRITNEKLKEMKESSGKPETEDLIKKTKIIAAKQEGASNNRVDAGSNGGVSITYKPVNKRGQKPAKSSPKLQVNVRD